MGAILKIQDLLVLRDSRPVLEIEYLEILPGEVLAIIGPNGAGKSTLLLVISRLLKPQGGRILFRDKDINEIGDLQYRRKLALVLQEPLLLNLSVYDNVAAGLRFRGLPSPEVDIQTRKWLDLLGIQDLPDRSARKISGGQAQRVSLARAFAVQPDILLLDEPFRSLDSPTRLHLLEDLREILASTKTTTIFVTHYLDEALYLGDRIAVLLEGKLRQVGPPDLVSSSPADPQVAQFVGIESILDGKVVANQDGRLTIDIKGSYLEAIGDYHAGKRVFVCLRPEEITLWTKGRILPSSARNRFTGPIVDISPHGPLVHVTIDCGFRLVAFITRASLSELELETGKVVTASFKASSIHLIPR